MPQSDNWILPSTPTAATSGLANLDSKMSFSFPMFDTPLCMGPSQLQQNYLVAQGPYSFPGQAASDHISQTWLKIRVNINK